MVRGPRQHLKRINAPSHWMLDKLGGVYAPRPVTASHGLTESIPLLLILRNKLGFALTAKEVTTILANRNVLVDGKVRTTPKYPVGFMDVLTIPTTGDRFRLLYDTKGRFVLHRIGEKEAEYKLCKVTKVETGIHGVPTVHTHDGRTIRYPFPGTQVHDTIKVNLKSGNMKQLIKFNVGSVCMITGGRNTGRIGEIINRESHPGAFEIVHIRDLAGNTFSTRRVNVFALGDGNVSLVTLPRGKGVKLSPIEDRKRKLQVAKRAKRGKKSSAQ